MLSPNARAPKERIFSTAVRPKLGKKGALDKYFNSGPPILALMDRQNDGDQIHLLCVGWRNLFPVVLLFQFFVLVGNRFWFYILLMYLEYHTVVLLC